MSIRPAFPQSANHGRKLLLLTAVVALIPALGWAQEYTVTNLGTLGGTTSNGNAVNDNGEVVGFANITGDAYGEAFLYAHGAMTDLAPGQSTFGSTAMAMNDQGNIVVNLNLDTIGDTETYLWNGTSLDNLGVGGGSSINASGMVVGTENRYWVYANGQVDTSPGYPLLAPAVFATASSVNSAGTIAAMCWDGNEYDYGWGCVLGPNVSYTLQSLDGGELPSIAINSYGVTCSSDINVNFSIWSNNGTETVAIPYGMCNGLNDFGVAVGYYFPPPSQNAVAAIYDRLHGIRELNSLVEHNRREPGFAVLNAVAVSNTGYIAANCQYTALHHKSVTHACLLTPNPAQILKDNILQLAKGDPDCIQCRTLLGPLAEELPSTLVGLSTAKQTKTSGVVNAIANDLLHLFTAAKIDQASETMLQHDCLMVQEALHRD